MLANMPYFSEIALHIPVLDGRRGRRIRMF
jgi:hypothetical protein